MTAITRPARRFVGPLWHLEIVRGGSSNSFDALRFVAACFVLIGHAWPLTGRNAEAGVGGWDSLSGTAVGVFFVISGYLVSASRLRSTGFADFVLRRALRIFPGLWLLCVLSVFALGPMVTSLAIGDYLFHPQTRAYFANLSMFDIAFALPGVFVRNAYPLAVNGSLWTLPIEFMMYLVLAIIGPLVLHKWRTLTMLLVMGAVWQQYGSIWAQAGTLIWTTLPAYYTLRFALFFFLGAAAYIWRDNLPLSPIVALGFWVATVVLAKTSFEQLSFIVAVSYSTLVLAAVPVTWLKSFGRFGDFSYGMYLYAFPVQQLLYYYFGAQTVFASIGQAFLGTLMLAIISWFLIERRFLTLKRS